MKAHLNSWSWVERTVFCLLMLTVVSGKCFSSEIYVGEPLGEAIFDLSSRAVLIGHDLSGGSSLKRTDVFKLRDGRVLAITSTAERQGQPFSVKVLQLASSPETSLTKGTAAQAKVDVPDK